MFSRAQICVVCIAGIFLADVSVSGTHAAICESPATAVCQYQGHPHAAASVAVLTYPLCLSSLSADVKVSVCSIYLDLSCLFQSLDFEPRVTSL